MADIRRDRPLEVAGMRVVGGGGALSSPPHAPRLCSGIWIPCQISFCSFAWLRTSDRREGQTGKATGSNAENLGYLSIPARPAGREKGKGAGNRDDGRGVLPREITLGSFLPRSLILPPMWLAADLAITRDLELRGYVRASQTRGSGVILGGGTQGT